MEETAKLDPSSPFYLGSGDQPGNLISHVILKGDNYLAWSRAITLSLKSRRKFGFVDGTISKPTEKKKMLDWDTVNSMLVSWILRATEPKLAASFPYFDEAKKLWDYLDTRFCEASGPRLQQLRSAITAFEQSKSMSVEEYYTTLMGLYDDLNRLKPPRGCECGKCECNLAALFAMDREEERLHQFLIEIDDTKYAQVRTNLLSQQPPVTLDRAYQAFLQEERSRAIAAAKPSRMRLTCSRFHLIVSPLIVLTNRNCIAPIASVRAMITRDVFYFTVIPSGGSKSSVGSGGDNRGPLRLPLLLNRRLLRRLLPAHMLFCLPLFLLLPQIAVMACLLLLLIRWAVLPCPLIVLLSLLFRTSNLNMCVYC
ncbi:Retrovirus-related Pol polyprotein from transposon RE1 [Bienertia sinuspersici]